MNVCMLVDEWFWKLSDWCASRIYKYPVSFYGFSRTFIKWEHSQMTYYKIEFLFRYPSRTYCIYKTITFTNRVGNIPDFKKKNPVHLPTKRRTRNFQLYASLLLSLHSRLGLLVYLHRYFHELYVHFTSFFPLRIPLPERPCYLPSES